MNDMTSKRAQRSPRCVRNHVPSEGPVGLPTALHEAKPTLLDVLSLDLATGQSTQSTNPSPAAPNVNTAGQSTQPSTGHTSTSAATSSSAGQSPQQPPKHTSPSWCGSAPLWLTSLPAAIASNCESLVELSLPNVVYTRSVQSMLSVSQYS